MPHFHIEELGPYNGDHEIDLSRFTNRELHTIKTIANVRSGQLFDALNEGDNDLLVALAVIALERKGHKPVNTDAIWDAPVGTIRFVVGDDEKEADADPPAETPPNEPASDDGNNVKTASSGVSSSTDSDRPGNPLSRTGSLRSATGAISDREISAA